MSEEIKLHPFDKLQAARRDIRMAQNEAATIGYNFIYSLLIDGQLSSLDIRAIRDIPMSVIRSVEADIERVRQSDLKRAAELEQIAF